MTLEDFPGERLGREVREVGLGGSGARASEGEGRAWGKSGAGRSLLWQNHCGRSLVLQSQHQEGLEPGEGELCVSFPLGEWNRRS